MQRAVIHRAFAHRWGGRPGAVGICTQSQEYGASGENSRPHAGLVEVAPRFSGRGPAAPARGWAFSSVGESARLITVRSLVRIQKGPRSEPARTTAPSPRGCSSAGRAPALQAGGRRFEPGHLHVATFESSLRAPVGATVAPSQIRIASLRE